MFDYVWNRIKSLVGASAVGQSEARHWHHRVYGGLVRPSPKILLSSAFTNSLLLSACKPRSSRSLKVDITTLLPSDLGAAAGYEALRLFNYHRTIYRQPLMDDREREEEALAGLAIAEGTYAFSLC